jgi:hypothetical protein
VRYCPAVPTKLKRDGTTFSDCDIFLTSATEDCPLNQSAVFSILLMCIYCPVVRIYKNPVAVCYKQASLLDELMTKYTKDLH